MATYTTFTRKENHLNRDECEENGKQDVFIWDVTLREGEQAPGITFNLKEKMEIASFMSELGVHEMDIAFPSQSFKEQEFVREIVSRNLDITLNATVKNSVADIDLSSELGIKNVNLRLPMNDLSSESRFVSGRPNDFLILKKVLEQAFKKNISVNLVGVDASRVDPAYVSEIFEFGFDLGAKRFVICDTVGTMEPYRMGEFVLNVICRMPRQAQFAIHCHNDFGLATANTLAAVDAGVKYVTVTVNGLGDRAGNASFEEVVLALEKIHKKKTGINLKRLFELSKLLEKISGLPIPISKPFVGHNVTCHAFDNYVTAMLKNQGLNDYFDPQEIGRDPGLIAGTEPLSSNVRELIEQTDIQLNPMELNTVIEKVKEYMTDQSRLEGLEERKGTGKEI